MPTLAKHHKVIVVEFRGIGSSNKPTEGYSKKNMYGEIAPLIEKMGLDKVSIPGQDIGANIAITLQTTFPSILTN
jgi:pimeloyl-ACP methyl ester carboxylesterase